MTRRIVYLTGTRADFGLMQSTLKRISQEPGLSLEVVATGMHLDPTLGNTIAEVNASGLHVCAEIPFDVATRTGASMSRGIADCLRGVTDVLDRERPDALVVLGDRGEMLAGAIAALHVGVPCVHVHGGELSGTVDEPVRHAISKLATYHFTATEQAKQRLVRMGEPVDRIHVVGAPGLDGLEALGTMPREQCLKELGLAPGARFLLAVFHPVVQQAAQAREQTRTVIEGLRQAGLPLVWLEPNADAGSREILEALDGAAWPAGSRRITHLPRPLFAAAMRHCEAMAGNSSAGIIEAATFATPVVNIGDRQRLREHGDNVVDVPVDAAAISGAVQRHLQRGRVPCDNRWGDGHTGERIATLLASLPLDAALLEKVNSY